MFFCCVRQPEGGQDVFSLLCNGGGGIHYSIAVWGKDDTAGEEEVDEDFGRYFVGFHHDYDV